MENKTMKDNKKITADVEVLTEIRDIQAKTYIVQKLSKHIAEVQRCVERYDNQPSIPNGSRMQQAREDLHKAIRKVAQEIMEKFRIPPEDFSKIVDELEIA